ncbi:MAG: dihydroneopterin aldolase [Fidelibacterota bacterium]
MGIIRLKNMQFYGYHGVSASEKHLGGKFEVDVELFTSFQQACQSDDLKDTINYEFIYHTVDKCIKQKKYYLIEALANSIAKTILTNFPVDSIVVRVRKPHAPVRGLLDTVEVEINREKDEYA